MQTLFYGLIGTKDSNLPQNQSKEDFETLSCPEDETINQIHRKIKLSNEFKKYIEKDD